MNSCSIEESMDVPERVRSLVTEGTEECGAEALDEEDRRLRRLAEAAGKEVESDVAVLSALSSDTRLRIVRALVAAEGEVCVCELDAVLDVSSSAVSHGLTTLRSAGLVTRRREGKWMHYDATERAERLLEVLE